MILNSQPFRMWSGEPHDKEVYHLCVSLLRYVCLSLYLWGLVTSWGRPFKRYTELFISKGDEIGLTRSVFEPTATSHKEWMVLRVRDFNHRPFCHILVLHQHHIYLYWNNMYAIVQCIIEKGQFLTGFRPYILIHVLRFTSFIKKKDIYKKLQVLQAFCMTNE